MNQSLVRLLCCELYFQFNFLTPQTTLDKALVEVAVSSLQSIKINEKGIK